MRSIGLAGVRLRRGHRSAVVGLTAVKAPDLIGCDFMVSGPNMRFVGGITYSPLDGGEFVCLAVVIASPRAA